MTASADLARVRVSGGDPVALVGTLFTELYQNSRGLGPGTLPIGMPETYFREIGFIRVIAIRMPEGNHPSDRLVVVHLCHYFPRLT